MVEANYRKKGKILKVNDNEDRHSGFEFAYSRVGQLYNGQIFGAISG
jgi:hypothetical protein